MITAKVVCNNRTETGAGDDREVRVDFTADYNDDRNKEWARYTPSLNLSMSLRGDVADRFQLGQAFTLTFEPEDPAEPVPVV